MHRETGGKREHRLRVYSELIFGHEADKPANGTTNYNRTCMPYPFKGEMTVDESATDFRIAIDGFKENCAPHHRCSPYAGIPLFSCVPPCEGSGRGERLKMSPHVFPHILQDRHD